LRTGDGVVDCGLLTGGAISDSIPTEFTLMISFDFIVIGLALIASGVARFANNTVQINAAASRIGIYIMTVRAVDDQNQESDA